MGPVDPRPATMMECPEYGAWDVETILTHSSADWWTAWWFGPLYATLSTQYNVSIITRIDYDWGETVPSPTHYSAGEWATNVCGVIDFFKEYCHIWIIGNEPNLIGEGDDWPDNKITPEGYAHIYTTIHAFVEATAGPSPLGEHQLLIAGVSPGAVQTGVRWMNGTNWLDKVLANIPPEKVDGVALHAYTPSTLSVFHNDYVAQIKAVDNRGLKNVPLYITEFNRYVAPGDTAQEAQSAEFIRQAFADIHAWNTTGPNHNIRCACWFVYDEDQQSGGGWDGYSLEYWRTHGNPEGTAGNEYTAFRNAVSHHYPAGITGTTPEPGLIVVYFFGIFVLLLRKKA